MDDGHPRRAGAPCIASPTDPLMRVMDVPAVAATAREHRLAAGRRHVREPHLRPREHGADVVISSATKYLNGHSDVPAGALAGSASLVAAVDIIRDLEQAMGSAEKRRQ